MSDENMSNENMPDWTIGTVQQLILGEDTYTYVDCGGGMYSTAFCNEEGFVVGTLYKDELSASSEEDYLVFRRTLHNLKRLTTKDLPRSRVAYLDQLRYSEETDQLDDHIILSIRSLKRDEIINSQTLVDRFINYREKLESTAAEIEELSIVLSKDSLNEANSRRYMKLRDTEQKYLATQAKLLHKLRESKRGLTIEYASDDFADVIHFFHEVLKTERMRKTRRTRPRSQ